MIALAFIFGLGIGAVAASLSYQQIIQQMTAEIDAALEELKESGK